MWVQEKPRIPLIVPPVDYHDLEGVQLGEQAAKIDSSTALDEMRDQIRDVVGTGVATGTWNEHKRDFLNLWTTGFDGQVPPATAVPFSDFEGLQSEVERLERENIDLSDANNRLRDFSRKLETQNEALRLHSDEAPPVPVLEEDEYAQFLAEAEGAIELAAKKMDALPSIAAEALFQLFHAGQPLTVGGTSDEFDIDVAKKYEEDGFLSLVEDLDQAVMPRRENPTIEEAESALKQVREIVFDGVSPYGRAAAGERSKSLLKEKYDITDPTFELRPVWEALGFL